MAARPSSKSKTPKRASDPTAWSLLEAAEAVRAGDISSVELTEACLARIRAREEEVQAWQFLSPDLALAQARAADQQRKEGKGIGRLHGVPIGVKDIIDTADMPTENGTPAHKGRQPSKDAACVNLLKAAGAVVMGKTVTTELASYHPGKTRNPHNPKHTPGGSSSGSAAAVAAHMVPAAVGTQTNGSVIRPAAFCGVFGFKPTLARIPRTGALTQSPQLDTIGVYGRSIEDLALLTECLSAYQPDADPFTFAQAGVPLLETARSEPPVPPLFAFVKTPMWDKLAEPALKEAYGELTEFLGGQAQEVTLSANFERAVDWHRTVMLGDFARHLGPIQEKAPEVISKQLTDLIEEGRKVTAAAYNEALANREKLYEVLDEIFTSYGPILTPPAAGPAPKGLDATGNPVFCTLWTFFGTPAVNLPLLEAGGLPIGVQLVGARRDDGRLLRAARWLVRHIEKA